MSQLVTIDPVTRIEGHLRIDVEVDGGLVRNAWSSGTMWRGIETILRDRDPRDGNGRAGPYEQALVGTPIADPKLLLEALRTIHSFDPCLACAIHTLDARGEEIARVKAL